MLVVLVAPETDLGAEEAGPMLSGIGSDVLGHVLDVELIGRAVLDAFSVG